MGVRHGVFGKSAARELAAAAVCAALVLGCSSSNDEASKPASQQCQDFESSYCQKAVECAQSTDRSDFQELCDFSWRVYLQCDHVTSATSVQECLNAIGAIQCSAVQPGSFPVSPAECRGLFYSR